MVNNSENELKLAEFLVSKIYHDLAGPIGAINNGFEFLTTSDDEMQQKAYELVEISIKQAMLRLQFFRQIYGSTSNTVKTSFNEIAAAINNFVDEKKTKIEWEVNNKSELLFDPKLAKLILNLIFIANNLLITSGNILIKISTVNDYKINIAITIKSQNIRFDEEVIKILQSPVIDYNLISAKNINFYLTRVMLNLQNISLTIARNDNEVKLIAE